MSVAPPGLVAMPEFTVIVASRSGTEMRSDWVAARLFSVVSRRTVNISRRQSETLSMACERTATLSKGPHGPIN